MNDKFLSGDEILSNEKNADAILKRAYEVLDDCTKSDLSPREWAKKALAENFSHLDGAKIDEIVNEIDTHIAGIEECFKDLQKAKQNGATRSAWLGSVHTNAITIMAKLMKARKVVSSLQ